MGYLLDTNICSAHFRRPGLLAHRFVQYGGRLYVPAVVLAEMYAGAYRLADPSRFVGGIDDLRRDVQILPFDERCAERFGRVRGALLRSGASVSTVDLMIAAVALSHDLKLVTNNTRDFAAIPDLRLEDWLTP